MNRNHSYKGFETLFNSARMNFKMYWYTFVFFLALHLCLFICSSYFYLRGPPERYSFFKTYSFAKIISYVKPSHILHLSLRDRPFSLEAGAYIQHYKTYKNECQGLAMFVGSGRPDLYSFVCN